MDTNRLLRIIWACGPTFAVCLLGTGCEAKMTLSPDLKPLDSISFSIKGRVICDGSPEYLPRTIVKADDAGLTFRYVHQESYGKNNVPELITLYSPATLLGVPMGTDDLVMAGQLDVMSGTQTHRSYKALCVMKNTRNIFTEGETFTAMRRRGLLALRDNLDAQLHQDRAFLEKVQALPPTATAATR